MREAVAVEAGSFGGILLLPFAVCGCLSSSVSPSEEKLSFSTTWRMRRHNGNSPRRRRDWLFKRMEDDTPVALLHVTPKTHP